MERERPAIGSSTVTDPVKQTAPIEVHHLPGNEVLKERDNPNTVASQLSLTEKISHTKSSNQTENPNTKNASQPPSAKDFNIPENEEEYNLMVEGMMKCGMKAIEAEANLKTRKTSFNKALRKFERDNKPPAVRKNARKGRKSSF